MIGSLITNFRDYISRRIRKIPERFQLPFILDLLLEEFNDYLFDFIQDSCYQSIFILLFSCLLSTAICTQLIKYKVLSHTRLLI